MENNTTGAIITSDNSTTTYTPVPPYVIHKTRNQASYITSEPNYSGSLLWIPYILLTICLFGLALLSFTRFHMKNGHKYHRRRCRMKQQARQILEDEAVTDEESMHETNPIFQVENHLVDSTFEQFKLYPMVFNGHQASMTASALPHTPDAKRPTPRGCAPIILRRSNSTGSMLVETLYDSYDSDGI